jgi:cell wall-associated NlpC family hydrolase
MPLLTSSQPKPRAPQLPITQCIVLIAGLVVQFGCSSTTPPSANRDLSAVSVKNTQPPVTPHAVTPAVSARPPILTVATSLMGTRYRYGGLSPDRGFDCSGFVYYSHHQIGIALPRTSAAQFKQTQPVARQNLSPGDLVFFRTPRGRINHVGIYLGQNRFIHAPGKGKVISITTLDNPYWEPRFARGGRPVI